MEFVIPRENIEILLKESQFIRYLFNVQVNIQQQTPVRGKQWVKLSSLSCQESECLSKAKDYIEALCCPEITRTILNSTNWLTKLESVTKQYSVVAKTDGDQNVILKGSQINVALAKSWMERENDGAFSSIEERENDGAFSSIEERENDGAFSSIEERENDGAFSNIEACKNFAIKLGYCYEDIEVVAKTLGSKHVDINIFIQELIRRVRSKKTAVSNCAVSRPNFTHFKRSDVVSRGVSFSNQSRESERCIIEAPRQGSDFESDSPTPQDLCPIIIDGSNVAMHHGNHSVFSCRGILLCVQWFQKRGHTEVYVLVPRYRAEPPKHDYPIKDQHILIDLHQKGVVEFTPSKRVEEGQDIVCYDDRFILDLAAKLEGVVVSNDEYRDLKHENPAWKYLIEKRVLMYSFVKDLFMVPEDPLGRRGPTLNEFLRKRVGITHPKVCPWLGHCTRGIKCRYFHPSDKNEGKEYGRQMQQKQHLVQHHQQRGRGQQLNYDSWKSRLQHDNGEYYKHQQSGGQQQQMCEQQLYGQQQLILQISKQQHLTEQQLVAQYPQQLNQQQHGQHVDQHATNTWHATCSIPHQFSYTPPTSFGYNNSTYTTQLTTFEKLVDIFPDKSDVIKCLLQENNGLKNIEQVVIDRLLDHSKYLIEDTKTVNN